MFLFFILYQGYIRRFKAHEALEHWQDAANDLEKVIELDSSLDTLYRPKLSYLKRSGEFFLLYPE